MWNNHFVNVFDLAMISHMLRFLWYWCYGLTNTVYEDNVARVTQMQTSYIKHNINKHISVRLFYPHELQYKNK